MDRGALTEQGQNLMEGIITKTNFRIFNDSRDKENIPAVKTEFFVLDAIKNLVRWELMFGGNISEITEIKLSTRVCGCKDIISYRGSKESILPLIQTSLLWLKASDKVSMDELSKKVVGLTNGSPLLITLGMGIFVGNARKEKFLHILNENLNLVGIKIDTLEN